MVQLIGRLICNMTIVMENISLSVWAVLHDVFEPKWPVTIIAQNDPTPIMYICTYIYQEG
jgi:hypothetical protein